MKKNNNILYVNDNRITQIDNLTALYKLEAINVSNNNIASLSVLRYYKDTLVFHDGSLQIILKGGITLTQEAVR